MDTIKASVPEGVRIGGGHLLQSLCRPQVWHYISEEGIESEVEYKNDIFTWKDYNLDWKKRREIQMHLQPEGTTEPKEDTSTEAA